MKKLLLSIIALSAITPVANLIAMQSNSSCLALFEEAVKNRDAEKIYHLLKGGVRVTENSKFLYGGAKSPGFNILKQDLTFTSTKNELPDTPLTIAIRLGDENMLENFLQKGEDPNANTSNGTPLDAAVQYNFMPGIKKLLASPKLTQQTKSLALSSATDQLNLETLDLLLQAKADPTVKDSTGMSALDLAKILPKYKPALEIFKKYGFQ